VRELLKRREKKLLLQFFEILVTDKVEFFGIGIFDVEKTKKR